MSRAIFEIIKTGKKVEASFEGAVYTSVVDDKGKKYAVNCEDAVAIFVEPIASVK